MSDNDKLELNGIVIHHCKDIFKVEIDGNPEMIVTAKISGKMRLHKINLQVGDTVVVEVSPYDTTRGRIVTRGKRQSRAERLAAQDAAGSGDEYRKDAKKKHNEAKSKAHEAENKKANAGSTTDESNQTKK